MIAARLSVYRNTFKGYTGSRGSSNEPHAPDGSIDRRDEVPRGQGRQPSFTTVSATVLIYSSEVDAE